MVDSMYHLRRINFACYLTPNKPVGDGAQNGGATTANSMDMINDKTEPTKNLTLRSKTTYILLDKITKIGRNPELVDVVLNSVNHGNMISREHSHIIGKIKDDGSGYTSYFICDKSLNGTYVNETRVTGTIELNAGDIIKFGHVNGAAVKPGQYAPQNTADFTFRFEKALIGYSYFGYTEKGVRNNPEKKRAYMQINSDRIDPLEAFPVIMNTSNNINNSSIPPDPSSRLNTSKQLGTFLTTSSSNSKTTNNSQLLTTAAQIQQHNVSQAMANLAAAGLQNFPSQASQVQQQRTRISNGSIDTSTVASVAQQLAASSPQVINFEATLNYLMNLNNINNIRQLYLNNSNQLWPGVAANLQQTLNQQSNSNYSPLRPSSNPYGNSVGGLPAPLPIPPTQFGTSIPSAFFPQVNNAALSCMVPNSSGSASNTASSQTASLASFLGSSSASIPNHSAYTSCTSAAQTNKQESPLARIAAAAQWHQQQQQVADVVAAAANRGVEDSRAFSIGFPAIASTSTAVLNTSATNNHTNNNNNDIHSASLHTTNLLKQLSVNLPLNHVVSSSELNKLTKNYNLSVEPNTICAKTKEGKMSNIIGDVDKASSPLTSNLNNSSSFSSTDTPPLPSGAVILPSNNNNNNKKFVTSITTLEDLHRSRNSSTSVSSISSTSLGHPTPTFKMENGDAQTLSLAPPQHFGHASTSSASNKLTDDLSRFTSTITTSATVICPSTNGGTSLLSNGLYKGGSITMNSLTDSFFDVNKIQQQQKNIQNVSNVSLLKTTEQAKNFILDHNAISSAISIPSSDLLQLAEAARAEISNSATNEKHGTSCENSLVTESISSSEGIKNVVKTMECDSSVPSPKPAIFQKFEAVLEKSDKINIRIGNEESEVFVFSKISRSPSNVSNNSSPVIKTRAESLQSPITNSDSGKSFLRFLYFLEAVENLPTKIKESKVPLSKKDSEEEADDSEKDGKSQKAAKPARKSNEVSRLLNDLTDPRCAWMYQAQRDQQRRKIENTSTGSSGNKQTLEDGTIISGSAKRKRQLRIEDRKQQEIQKRKGHKLMRQLSDESSDEEFSVDKPDLDKLESNNGIQTEKTSEDFINEKKVSRKRPHRSTSCDENSEGGNISDAGSSVASNSTRKTGIVAKRFHKDSSLNKSDNGNKKTSSEIKNMKKDVLGNKSHDSLEIKKVKKISTQEKRRLMDKKRKEENETNKLKMKSKKVDKSFKKSTTTKLANSNNNSNKRRAHELTETSDTSETSADENLDDTTGLNGTYRKQHTSDSISKSSKHGSIEKTLRNGSAKKDFVSKNNVAKSITAKSKNMSNSNQQTKDEGWSYHDPEKDMCAHSQCQRPPDPKVNWICCDLCDQWFHCICALGHNDKGQDMDEFLCGCKVKA